MEHRDARGGRRADDLVQDIYYGLRRLTKHASFTLLAVLTLGLGIGATTAVFSVVNAVLLKPLPFPAPEELIAFGFSDKHQTTSPVRIGTLSYPDFFDFREQNRTLSHLAIYRERLFGVVEEQQAKAVSAQIVSAEFFDLLGSKPQLGRSFSRADEQAGGGAGGMKVILSHDFWQRHFNGDSTVLGRILRLDRVSYMVIGVMPAAFQYPIQGEPSEVYVTIAEDASNADGSIPSTVRRDNYGLRAIGRLKRGVDMAQAASDLTAIAAALEEQYPDTNTNEGAAVRPLRDQLVGDVRAELYVLFGAVVCVLLIANMNVANLLLAQTSTRGKEIALRAALGASRSRIFRQLLTESLLLSGLASAFGLLVAWLGTDILIALVPQNIPRASPIQLDTVVIGFTLLVSLGTGIAFGCVPAWRASRVDLITGLKSGTRVSGGAGRTLHLRDCFVIGEIALALVLLICAGLLIRSFARLEQVELGLSTKGLLTARIELPDAVYPRLENVVGFFDQLLSRIRAIPGVEAASTVYPLPLSGLNVVSSFDIEEHPVSEREQPDSPTRMVGGDYFKTMGISLLQGRTFSEADRLGSPPVVIVNERLADKFFAGQNLVGKRIKPSWPIADNPPLMREIIGVVGNVKHRSPRSEDTPEIYLPASQAPISAPTLVVRTKVSNPASVTPAIRAELAALDPDLPLTRVLVFDEYVSRSLAGSRFSALLLSLFSVIALLLTAIGIYGVIAYSVVQRTSEIGLRIALGAGKSSIFRFIIGHALTLVAISLALGLSAAFAATHLFNSLLYGVGAWDPLTYIVIGLLVSVLGVLAAWLPARSAAAVDPVLALRAD